MFGENDENDEKLYTVQELAITGRLRISKTSIWREIYDGKLSSYKLRGQVFISERHIREYLADCENRRSPKSTFLENSFFSYATR